MKSKQQKIIKQALSLIPFDGWNDKMLMEAAKKAGLEPEFALIAFPNGTSGAIKFFMEQLDHEMLKKIEASNFNTLKIREKIAFAIQARIELYQDIKPVIRKTVSFLAMPQNTPLATSLSWNTADTIWYAAGDQSTDFNYYTKRALLIGVYSSTLLYWLKDDSITNQRTWAFLKRRIDNVMTINTIKTKIKNLFSKTQKI